MGLLDGKRGLVFGVANDRSIAWHIAEQMIAHGATCAFTHLPGEKMERRARKAIESGGCTDPWLMPCDASSDEDLDKVFAKVREDFDTIDFVIHSIAFADREYLQIGNFAETTREAFCKALDISAYTLVAMAKRAAPLMTNGGSIIAMSYYGSEKVVPGYNVMGVAKAALEANARYLAQRGAAVLLPQAEMSEARLVADLHGFLAAPAQLATMARAALAAATPEATAQVSDCCEELIRGC